MSRASNPDDGNIVEEIIENYNSAETVHGILISKWEQNGQHQTTKMEIWERPPDNLRKDILNIEPEGENTGDIIIMNGATFHWYKAAEDRVVESVGEQAGSQSPVTYASQLGHMIKNEFDVQFVKQDPVGEHSTHVISLLPNENTDEVNKLYSHATIWIDMEYYYPLKWKYSRSKNGQEATNTYVFDEISFNKDINDSIFAIDQAI